MGIKIELDTIQVLCNEFDNDEAYEGFIGIHQSEWVGDGTYDVQSTYVKHIETGVYYELVCTRSGSYFSDYDYEYMDNPVEIPYSVLLTIVLFSKDTFKQLIQDTIGDIYQSQGVVAGETEIGTIFKELHDYIKECMKG